MAKRNSLTEKKGVDGAPRSGLPLLVLLLLPISLAALIGLLVYGKPLLLPLALALGLQVLLAPLLELLHRSLRLPRSIGLLLVFSAAVGLALLLAAWGLSGAKGLMKELPSLQATAQARVEQAVVWAEGQGLPSPDLAELRTSFDKQVAKVFSWASQALTGSLRLLGTTLLILFFLLLDTARRPGQDAGASAAVRRYLLVKTGASVLTGLATFAVLAALGVPKPAALGFATFALNYIPYAGSMVAVALVVPVVLGSGGDLSQLVAAVGACTALQVAIGSVMEPRVMGQALAMPPVAVLLSLVAWSLLWGAPGALVALPATVALRGWISEHPQLKAAILQAVGGLDWLKGGAAGKS